MLKAPCGGCRLSRPLSRLFKGEQVSSLRDKIERERERERERES